MGLLHGRELLIVPPRVAPLACAVSLLAAIACGGGEPEAGNAEAPAPTPLSEPAVSGENAPGDAGEGEVTLLQSIPNGSPMPEAARVGGVPPYPGAVVHTRQPRDRPGLRSFEAFTPDSWTTVQAHYDTTLGNEWVKIDAEDTTVYQKENDRAAITLTSWAAEDLPGRVDHPAVLREARTIIGVAWRTDSP